MRCQVAPWCSQMERLLWAEKGTLSPPECSPAVKTELLPLASPDQSLSNNSTSVPLPPLPPFLFTETSFPKGSMIAKSGGHFSGLLTELSGACDTANHPARGTLSSLGCPGPCCPAPSAMVAASPLPPLFIFLQHPLICCHYPGVSVCSGCYNRAP